MLVGECGAGKTSLARSFLGKPFNKEHDSTLGISWSKAGSKGVCDLTRTTVARWEEQACDFSALDYACARAFLGIKTTGNISEYVEPAMESGQPPLAAKGEASIVPSDPASIAVVDAPTATLEENHGSEDTKQTKADVDMHMAGDWERRGQQAPAQRSITVLGSKDMNESPRLPEGCSQAPPPKSSLPFPRRYQCDESLLRQITEDGRVILYELWDFGGQDDFYAIHHLFLTRFGV
eukprot:gene57537-biopygen20833